MEMPQKKEKKGEIQGIPARFDISEGISGPGDPVLYSNMDFFWNLDAARRGP
jgi:hypothetical protein